MNYKVEFNLAESGEIFVSLVNTIDSNIVFHEKVTDKVALLVEQTMSDVSHELSQARSLLYDAQDLLDNIHGYDTETYREISRFLDGDEDEIEGDI